MQRLRAHEAPQGGERVSQLQKNSGSRPYRRSRRRGTGHTCRLEKIAGFDARRPVGDLPARSARGCSARLRLRLRLSLNPPCGRRLADMTGAFPCPDVFALCSQPVNAPVACRVVTFPGKRDSPYSAISAVSLSAVALTEPLETSSKPARSRIRTSSSTRRYWRPSCPARALIEVAG